MEWREISMPKKFSKFIGFLLLSGFVCSMTFAQRQTGSITGKVIDEEGQPLPGASVTLSGPSLLGTQTYITTEEGNFRFPAVPPGRNYALAAELSGFQPVSQQEIIVSVGKTFTIIIELKQSALEEEITVVGAAPTVDIKSSKQSVTYTSEMMNDVPLERDYYSIILSAPGIISDTSEPTQRVFVSHGSTARDNQVALEGVSITDTAVRSNKIGFSFDIFEEVEFELGAHPAEVGMTPGGYVNIVTKSGGNTFSGSLNAQYFGEGLVKNLIPGSEAEAVGLERPTGFKSYNDFSASLGGPVLKDKLWFFLNGRFLNWKKEEITIVDGVFEAPHDEINAFSKFTFQAFPSLKLTGMLSYRDFTEEFMARPTIGYYASKYTNFDYENAKNWVVLGMANWILNQNTFVDFRVQYNYKIDPYHAHPDIDPDTPSILDYYTGIRTASPRIFYYDFIAPRFQATVSFNRFLDDFLGGNHEIKAGIELDRARLLFAPYKPTPISNLFTYQGLPWAFQDAEPYLGYFWAWKVGEKPEDYENDFLTRRYSAYIQDSFTINRVTLNIGLRYDESHADVIGKDITPVGSTSPLLMSLSPETFKPFSFPDYKNVMVWKDFSPRLGLVVDIFGDQTTTFKASWSRYNEYLNQGYTSIITPADAALFAAYWYDVDRNGMMDLTDSYTVLMEPAPYDPSTWDLDDYRDPNLKSPYTDEFIFGLERELFKDFSISVSYYYKNKNRMIDNVEKFRGNTPDSGWWVPYTTNEPGWDGEYGTADDKQITVYGVKKGAPPSRLWWSNPSEEEYKYNGLEFVFQKRMSKGWQLLASVTLSKLEGTIDGSYGMDYGSSFDTPNWMVNRYGRQLFDRPVLIKLQGSIILPLNFMLSGFYQHSSGSPWGRTLMIQLPDNAETLEYPGTFVETVLAESPGTRRYASRNNLDLRLEKFFRIGRIGSLAFYLDVLNVFGERGYTIDEDPGGRVFVDGTFERWPNYGQFTGIYGLRTYKLSARFSF